MKLIKTLSFLSSLCFLADAKCGESPPSPSNNILSQSADTIRIDATKYCESSGVQIDQGHYVGYLDPNDWMAFDIELLSAGSYQVTYSVASMNGKGAFQLEKLGGSPVYGSISSIPATGGWYNFATVTHTVQLPNGKQGIALSIQQGEFNLDWIEFKNLAGVDSSNPTPSACRADEYTLLNLSQASRIDAANFCDAKGVAVRASEKGGFHVGRINENAFIAYNVEAPKAALYRINYQVGIKEGSGGFVVEVYDQTGFGSVSKQVNVPSTGGWQKWAIVSQTIYLPKGKNILVLRGKGLGWNLKSMEIRLGSMSPVAPVPASAPVSSPIRAPVAIPVPVSAPVATPVKPPVAPTPGKGFVRADGKRIVDGNGNNLILRGQGLGGWMLQEPYQMLAVEAAPKGQWQMFQKIEQTVGAAGLEQYRQAWLDNWFTYEDVKELKRSGFNSIRVALHYNLFTLPIEKEPVRGQDTWIQKGFDRLDALLAWCQTERMYLILDLHAAAGGQGRNSAINDYDDSKPSLWEDEENVRKTISLWAKWAARYKDSPWIAGYDLLNEPNWNFDPGHPNGCSEQRNAPLKSFYDRTIAAIRKVDANHLIYINGNCWGNNHKGLWPFADKNVALSFHRYWIDNTDASIQEFLDMREKYNVPLWLGESGENTDFWYSQAVQLLERHNIGWAWWTWKKLQSSSGSYSISPPDQYQALVNYWAYGGTKPANAIGILMKLTENALLKNCKRNDGAITSLTGFRSTCEDAALIDVLSSTTRLEAESYCNMMGINTEMAVDADGGFNTGVLGEGGWIAYNINAGDDAGEFRVDYRISSIDGAGAFRVSLFDTAGEVVGLMPSLPATGDAQNWVTVSNEIFLPAGKSILVITSEAAGWDIKWLELSRKA